MTPATLIARLDAAIAGYGQGVTLRRLAVDSEGAETVAQEVTCAAKVRRFGPQDVEAPAQDIQVILSPTGLGAFGVPARDDRILIGDEQNPSDIKQIAPLYYGGALVRVNLLCRG